MTAVPNEPCLECGAPSCAEVYDELLALEFTRTPPFAAWHAITVAAYGVQHPSRSAPEIRRVQWRFLGLVDSEGLPAVARLAARRVAANSHRHGGLRTAALVADVDEVPVPPSDAATIRDVLTPDGTLDAAGHDERMLAWAHDLVTRSAPHPS